MTAAYCKECGERIHREPNEVWKVLCLGCWRETKRKERGELEAELDEVREENDYLRRGIRQLQSNACTHQACRELFKHQRFLLKRLHPDVNENCEEATEVPRLLLDLNEKARELGGGAGGKHEGPKE